MAEFKEDEYVHKVYNEIAPHFSQTRYKPWPIVTDFLLNKPSGSIGIDIGCGNGKYLGINPDIFIIGSDRSSGLIECAHELNPKGYNVLVADGMHLPHPNNRFDFAISIAVVHHWSTRERRIEAIRHISVSYTHLDVYKRQNLGCGSDLRMIHLLKRNPDLQYIDIDFKDSVKLKKSVLVNSELFKSILQLHGQIADSDANNRVEDELITARYKLLSCDLKNLDRVLSLLSTHTSKEIPTLIITECVLCYMPQTEAQALVEAVISFYDHGKWVSYDPIGGSKSNDRFGSIMQNNLWESRQLDMPTLMIYNSKETYAQRFVNLVISTKIKTMWDYYTDNVSLSEKQRLKGLQFLDEIEELRLILSHYIILEATW